MLHILVRLRLAAAATGLSLLAACAPEAPPPAQPPPAPAPPPPATAAPATPAARAHHDVIIVGAGMAGITAARTLRRENLDVLVIEATDRIGGRGVTTKDRFSAPIDLGGAWIHGVKTNPLTPVIVGMGYRTQRTEVEAAKHLFYAHAFTKGAAQVAFEEAYTAFEKALEETFGAEGDEVKAADGSYLSAAAFVDAKCKGKGKGSDKGKGKCKELDPVARRLLILNAGPLEGATELEKSSLEDANDFVSDDDDFLRKGYGTFVEEYGEEIRPITRLGSPVTKITRVKGGVEVATAGEVFEGSKVLVTVSTGVLAAGKIAFEPPLDRSKVDALEGLPMGLLNKVILEFKTPDVFPLHDGKPLANTWVLYGGDDPKGHDDLAFVLQPMATNIAVGFFGGERAWKLEDEPARENGKESDHGEATMVAVAVKALDDMCQHSRPAAQQGQCHAGAALTRHEITAWGHHPWTLGAYSAALPGMAKMREVLAHPIEHTVYFAGEACFNASYNGSFAAAYSSALRSSYAIAECLRREKRSQACEWLPLKEP